jgi:hypothetical protein
MTLFTPITTTTVKGEWNITSGYEPLMLRTDYTIITNSPISSAVSGAVAPLKLLISQFITPPLTRQTLNGTLTGQAKMKISAATTNIGQGFIYVRLINPNGTVAQELGTLTTTDLVRGSATVTNRTFLPLTLTGVAITGGQRIAIELGWNFSAGTATGITGQYVRQNNRATTDLPIDDISTDNLNPWFQFSQSLRLQTQNIFF